MKVYAGIDGGGTRTRLALARTDGKLLALVEGGCCSFVELGLDGAAQVLGGLWHDAWRSAGADLSPAEALFIGTGSILSVEDERINCELALRLNLVLPGKVRAGNDALNALVGKLSARPGILLISGTGSACLGRNARGQTWRAGGWGHLLNDTGSAYALGLGAIIAATRAADGRGPLTSLSGLVLEHLGLTDLKEIYRKLHHEGVSRAHIAALAPRVVSAAEADDVVAEQLLRTGSDGLVEMVVTVAHRLGLACPELALTGGLITHAERFRSMFLERVAAALPGFRLVTQGFEPVFGAVMLACETATGALPTQAFLENLAPRTSTFTAS